jgi:hypothetical protein
LLIYDFEFVSDFDIRFSDFLRFLLIPQSLCSLKKHFAITGEVNHEKISPLPFLLGQGYSFNWGKKFINNIRQNVASLPIVLSTEIIGYYNNVDVAAFVVRVGSERSIKNESGPVEFAALRFLDEIAPRFL